STDARRLSSARFFRLQYNIYMWLKRYHAAAPGDGGGRPDKTPPVPRFDEETGAPTRGDEAAASNEPSLKPGPETAPIDLSGLDALGRRPIIDPNATQALDLNSLDSLGGELARQSPERRAPFDTGSRVVGPEA